MEMKRFFLWISMDKQLKFLREKKKDVFDHQQKKITLVLVTIGKYK